MVGALGGKQGEGEEEGEGGRRRGGEEGRGEERKGGRARKGREKGKQKGREGEGEREERKGRGRRKGRGEGEELNQLSIYTSCRHIYCYSDSILNNMNNRQSLPTDHCHWWVPLSIHRPKLHPLRPPPTARPGR